MFAPPRRGTRPRPATRASSAGAGSRRKRTRDPADTRAGSRGTRQGRRGQSAGTAPRRRQAAARQVEPPQDPPHPVDMFIESPSRMIDHYAQQVQSRRLREGRAPAPPHRHHHHHHPQPRHRSNPRPDTAASSVLEWCASISGIHAPRRPHQGDLHHHPLHHRHPAGSDVSSELSSDIDGVGGGAPPYHANPHPPTGRWQERGFNASLPVVLSDAGRGRSASPEQFGGMPHHRDPMGWTASRGGSGTPMDGPAFVQQRRQRRSSAERVRHDGGGEEIVIDPIAAIVDGGGSRSRSGGSGGGGSAAWGDPPMQQQQHHRGFGFPGHPGGGGGGGGGRSTSPLWAHPEKPDLPPDHWWHTYKSLQRDSHGDMEPDVSVSSDGSSTQLDLDGILRDQSGIASDSSGEGHGRRRGSGSRQHRNHHHHHPRGRGAAAPPAPDEMSDAGGQTDPMSDPEARWRGGGGGGAARASRSHTPPHLQRLRDNEIGGGGGGGGGDGGGGRRGGAKPRHQPPPRESHNPERVRGGGAYDVLPVADFLPSIGKAQQQHSHHHHPHTTAASPPPTSPGKRGRDLLVLPGGGGESEGGGGGAIFTEGREAVNPGTASPPAIQPHTAVRAPRRLSAGQHRAPAGAPLQRGGGVGGARPPSPPAPAGPTLAEAVLTEGACFDRNYGRKSNAEGVFPPGLPPPQRQGRRGGGGGGGGGGAGLHYLQEGLGDDSDSGSDAGGAAGGRRVAQLVRDVRTPREEGRKPGGVGGVAAGGDAPPAPPSQRRGSRSALEEADVVNIAKSGENEFVRLTNGRAIGELLAQHGGDCLEVLHALIIQGNTLAVAQFHSDLKTGNPPPGAALPEDSFLRCKGTGATPVIAAMREKKYDILKYLLRGAGEEIYLCDAKGWSVFHYACERAGYSVLAALLSGVPDKSRRRELLNKKDFGSGATALHVLLRSGDTGDELRECLSLLIQSGCDLTIEDDALKESPARLMLRDDLVDILRKNSRPILQHLRFMSDNEKPCPEALRGIVEDAARKDLPAPVVRFTFLTPFKEFDSQGFHKRMLGDYRSYGVTKKNFCILSLQRAEPEDVLKIIGDLQSYEGHGSGKGDTHPSSEGTLLRLQVSEMENAMEIASILKSMETRPGVRVTIESKKDTEEAQSAKPAEPPRDVAAEKPNQGGGGTGTAPPSPAGRRGAGERAGAAPDAVPVPLLPVGDKVFNDRPGGHVNGTHPPLLTPPDLPLGVSTLPVGNGFSSRAHDVFTSIGVAEAAVERYDATRDGGLSVDEWNAMLRDLGSVPVTLKSFESMCRRSSLDPRVGLTAGSLCDLLTPQTEISLREVLSVPTIGKVVTASRLQNREALNGRQGVVKGYKKQNVCYVDFYPERGGAVTPHAVNVRNLSWDGKLSWLEPPSRVPHFESLYLNKRVFYDEFVESCKDTTGDWVQYRGDHEFHNFKVFSVCEKQVSSVMEMIHAAEELDSFVNNLEAVKIVLAPPPLLGYGSVKITGVREVRSLNGKQGSVVSVRDKGQVVMVNIPGIACAAPISCFNVVPVSHEVAHRGFEPRPSPHELPEWVNTGVQVRVAGLTIHSELNGQVGTIVHVRTLDNVAIVKLPGVMEAPLRHTNLRPIVLQEDLVPPPRQFSPPKQPPSRGTFPTPRGRRGMDRRALRSVVRHSKEEELVDPIVGYTDPHTGQRFFPL